MYKKLAVNSITNAIVDVLMPKFRIYIRDRKNDVSIQEQIDAELSNIDDLEDTIIEMTNGLSFSSGDSITLGDNHFYYNTEQDAFLHVDKVNHVTEKILKKNGLWGHWAMEGEVKRRIHAIVSTLEPVSFEDALEIVEKQIDFTEFISRNKGK